MMDDMVELLGKEQKDDEQKKEYCEKEFEVSEDKDAELKRNIKGVRSRESQWRFAYFYSVRCVRSTEYSVLIAAPGATQFGVLWLATRGGSGVSTRPLD